MRGIQTVFIQCPRAFHTMYTLVAMSIILHFVCMLTILLATAQSKP